MCLTSLSFCLPTLWAEYLHGSNLEKHQKYTKGWGCSRAGFGSSTHTTTGWITLWINSSISHRTWTIQRGEKCTKKGKRYKEGKTLEGPCRAGFSEPAARPFQELRWHSVVPGVTAQPRSRRENPAPSAALGMPGSAGDKPETCSWHWSPRDTLV